MVTSRKRSVTSAGSGQPQGCSLVVQVSGGARRAQAASPRQAKTNLNFRGNRVDTIFRAGLWPRSFFGKSLTHFVRDEAAMTAPANPIHRSFELAAQRCEDLTPLVYARLFREHPEAKSMFRSEGSELVRGSMLALTIDAILDFAGDRSGHFRMIECEVSSHDAYGTPRELFVAFFGVIARTLHELLGTDWSPEIDVA